MVYYGLWSWPEERWLTGWDLLRKSNPVDDAILVFHSPNAAADSADFLPESLKPLVIIRPFVEAQDDDTKE